jgi:alanine racemase
LRVSSLAEAVALRDGGVTVELLSPVAASDAGIASDRDIRPLDESFEAQDDAARRDLGVGVYGLAAPAGLATEAVMTLEAEVIAIKSVEAGTGVSYGYTYRAPSTTTIALVSIGYADGVPRLASNTTAATIAGVAYPVVGRIAMDQLVLDIGAASASPGDTVTVFGDPASGASTAVEWALRTRRLPANLTAGLGRRVERVFPRGGGSL